MNVVRCFLFISILLSSCQKEPAPAMSNSSRMYQFIEQFEWGFVNAKGNLIIPDQYQKVEDFSGGLALVKQNNKFFFIDTANNKQFSKKFTAATSFQNGYAAVSTDSKMFYLIDTKGRQVSSQFDEIISFKKQSIIGRKEGVQAVYTFDGEPRSKPNEHPIQLLAQGYVFEQDDLYGLVLGGDVVLEPMFSRIIPFGNRFFCKKDKQWSYFQGSNLRPLKASQVKVGINKVAIKRDGRFGLFNASLRSVSSETYLNILHIGADSWVVQQKDGHYLLYKERLIGPFDRVGKMVEGLAPVKKGAKWGYIDTKGNLVIPYTFSLVWSFSEGYARVVKDEKYYFVDTKGKTTTLNQSILDLRDLNDGLAKAQIFRK